MTRMTLLAILALSMGACENTNPGGEDNVCVDCGDADADADADTDTDTDADMGTLTVNASIVDILSKGYVAIDTVVNVVALSDGELVGTYPTGEPVELPVGEYTLSIGDLTEANDASGNIPLYIDETGMWISPYIRFIEVAEGEDTSVDAPMNMFIEGEWTCYSSDFDNYYTDEASYDDGYEVYLPGIGDNEVDGIDISYQDGDIVNNGEFITSTFASVEISGSMAGDQTVDCWEGDESDEEVRRAMANR